MIFDLTPEQLRSVALAFAFLCLVGAGAYVLWRLQHSREGFDLADLIIDKYSGRVSLGKFGQLIALMVSTWGFVHLTVSEKLTEFYFIGYMAAWAGAHVASMAVKAKNGGGSANPG